MMGVLVAGLLVMGCDDDEDNGPSNDANTKTYTLAAVDNSGVSGTVTFAKENESTTKVTINVSGTMEGNSHPAHIHSGAVTAGAPIVVDLNAVDGATGTSETMVTSFNDGQTATYEQLIEYNGHVNVHKSITELTVLIAQGNIGSNATGTTGGTGSSGNGNGNGNGGY